MVLVDELKVRNGHFLNERRGKITEKSRMKQMILGVD